MSMDEEQNLTAAVKYARVLEDSAKQLMVAVEKAKANGVVTRAEADKDRQSVNRTTWAAAAAAIIAIFTIVHYVLDPVIKRQDDQGSDMKEIQKDIRELYRVSPSAQKSDRLDRPVPAESVK